MAGFLLERSDQRGNVGRLGEVIVHLLADSFERRLEIRISGQNECGGARLNSAHGADQYESIGRAADVQIGEQHVELAMADELQRFRHRCRHRYVEPLLFQDRGKGHPDRSFVINE